MLQELAKTAFCDIRRLFKSDGALVPSGLDEATAAAIASLEVQSRRQGAFRPAVTVTKVRLVDRLRALERLAKCFGLIKERVEVDVDIAKLETFPSERLAEVRELALVARQTVQSLRRA